MPEIQSTHLPEVEDIGFSNREFAKDMAGFEQEFSNNRTLELPGRQVQVVEVGRPEVTDSDKTPIVIAGGWAEDSETFKGTMQTLYERGRWVIMIDHPASDEVGAKPKNYHEVMEVMGIEKADIIAHSGGAGDTLQWASLHPEQVRNIVLANPNGLNGGDNMLSMAARFAVKQAMLGISDRNNPNARRAMLSGMKKLAGISNVKQGWTEARAITNADITEAIGELRTKGHKIGVLQSYSDPIFLADRIADNVVNDSGELRIDAYASAVDQFAGHDDLIAHPERSAIAVDQMLRSFETTPYPSSVISKS